MFKSIVVLLSFLLFFVSLPAIASQKAPNSEELRQIQEKLKGVKKKVQESTRKEKHVLTDLDKINRNLQVKKMEVKRLEGKLGVVSRKMSATQSEMSGYQANVQARGKDLAGRLREMYKTRRAGSEWILLLSGDYGSILRRYKYLEAISERDQRMIQGYEESIDELAKYNNRLNKQKANFSKIKMTRDAEAAKVQTEEARKKKLLANIQRQKSSYEAMARSLEKQSRRMKELIRRLEAQARSRRLPALPGNLPALRGGLNWPVAGKVVSFFGRQMLPVYNTYIYNKGIKIAAPAGSLVRAVEAGQVAFANFFKGLGLIVILRHGGGYYSVYAHLANLKVKTGQKVRKAQPIAVLGNAGPAGSSLYFEVRKGAEAIDPLLWLKRR